jgi:hypothetical protein
MKLEFMESIFQFLDLFNVLIKFIKWIMITQYDHDNCIANFSWIILQYNNLFLS